MYTLSLLCLKNVHFLVMVSKLNMNFVVKKIKLQLGRPAVRGKAIMARGTIARPVTGMMGIAPAIGKGVSGTRRKPVSCRMLPDVSIPQCTFFVQSLQGFLTFLGQVFLNFFHFFLFSLA